MRLSTKARYGVRAMLTLALEYGNAAVPVRTVARYQRVSEKYLEHLMVSLKSAGLVRSVRGRGGGYTLARPPEQIDLSEVVRALEGSIAPVDCVDDPGVCDRSDACAARAVWGRMQQAMDDVLRLTTLRDLAEEQNERAQSRGTMYQI
jgi:Rrf2 family protein